ncbi:MAG: molybdopterin-dependent oxidoreductase, partial [Thaumarchaeota archaeon]|nr:molybdopterin-dependent oxidoreductase [Nitrososphaerota archaeon]
MELIANHMKGRDDPDGVVRSACNLCQNFCGLLAYKKNGQVIRLEGDPNNPRNYGHLCAKGLSGFLSLHSPKRVTKPLIRTNPEKGVGVDPKWKEISWSEAIDIFADRIRRLLQDPKGYNPSKILVSTFDHWGTYFGVQAAWCNALQCQKSTLSAACFCGNAVHPPSLLNTATFEITPDAEYARYLLLIGSQAGSIIHYDTMNVARHIAEKRPGEVKVVVVDPLCSHAASRSEEWIPIRPGTDAAFILALVNLLINEYGIYDAKFLKGKTNASYLIGENGLYIRDSESEKPLIWDPVDGKAKCFDDPAIKDHALEGSYVANDAPCSPSFQLLKDHVKKYTPEKVSEITTIPAETIRRIAKEYGESACIGKTINIDGAEVPYRPVSVVWYRGLSAHKHAYLAGFAIMLLPTLMGAIQVPGGIQGHPRAEEYVTQDGLMAVKDSGVVRWRGPYPNRAVVKPKRLDLFELFPVAAYSSAMMIPALLEPNKFGFDTDSPIPEILLMYRENPVKNTIAPEIVVEALKKIPFIVNFAVELDDTSNIADLVFPDIHYLERLAESMYNRVDEPGFWYAAKPSMSPPFDPPYDKLCNNAEVLLEVADRAGFLPQVVSTLN